MGPKVKTTHCKVSSSQDDRAAGAKLARVRGYKVQMMRETSNLSIKPLITERSALNVNGRTRAPPNPLHTLTSRKERGIENNAAGRL